MSRVIFLSWHISLDICDYYGIPYKKLEKRDVIIVVLIYKEIDNCYYQAILRWHIQKCFSREI